VLIRRSPRRERFTIVANDSARDPRLSLRARGLLVTLLSLPDGWQTSTLAISRDVREGRDAVRVAARELEEAGYLMREKRPNEKGQWTTTWTLFDESQIPL
jgi:predicted transcriptional regulator